VVHHLEYEETEGERGDEDDANGSEGTTRAREP
jgi:hypothetical protein